MTGPADKGDDRPLAFGFHHGGVSVPDLDAAARWYADVLGFSEEARQDVASIDGRIAFLVNGPLRIELIEPGRARPLAEERRDPHRDARTAGNKHIALVVADLSDFLAAVEARGARIVWRTPGPRPVGAFIADIAGNLIELVEGALPADTASID